MIEEKIIDPFDWQVSRRAALKAVLKYLDTRKKVVSFQYNSSPFNISFEVDTNLFYITNIVEDTPNNQTSETGGENHIEVTNQSLSTSKKNISLQFLSAPAAIMNINHMTFTLSNVLYINANTSIHSCCTRGKIEWPLPW